MLRTIGDMEENKENTTNESTATERDADFNELDNPEAMLKRVQADLEASRQDYLRALADLENYKKRTMKERSDMLKYQGEKVIFDLLEVVDNLELALAQEQKTVDEFKNGVSLIHKMFIDTLEKWGVKGDSAIGKTFDANTQEAIGMLESPDHKAGTVIQELKKSYVYKDRLLRPGKVVISKESEKAV